jgi:hypothetical protein
MKLVSGHFNVLIAGIVTDADGRTVNIAEVL